MSQGVDLIEATAALALPCQDSPSLSASFQVTPSALWPQTSRPEKPALSGHLPKGAGPPTHLHLLPGETWVLATREGWGT